jgi:large conductance mechanosensitive channel
MFKEFKEFALRGNMVDMAVGIIMGSAFGAVVSSLVKDVLMPPLGLALGKVDFSNMFVVLKEGGIAAPYASLDAAKAAGAVTFNYGIFINQIIALLIVAFALFLLIRSINRMRRKQEAPPAAPARSCPFCFQPLHDKATRCPHCTSNLPG